MIKLRPVARLAAGAAGAGGGAAGGVAGFVSSAFFVSGLVEEFAGVCETLFCPSALACFAGAVAPVAGAEGWYVGAFPQATSSRLPDSIAA